MCDVLLVVALIPQLLNADQQLQRAEFAPCDVLRQAHDEGRFVVDVHHHRGDFLVAERLEGLETPLTADEQVMLAIIPRARRHDDRLFQADALDVADDLFEHAAVALAWIENLDPVQRDHPQFRVAMLFVLVHAALRMRMRRAMPYR